MKKQINPGKQNSSAGTALFILSARKAVIRNVDTIRLGIEIK
ncbi:MAG: hypothetical protein V1872_10680 [bacterium]